MFDQSEKLPVADAARALGMSTGQAVRTCLRGISIRGVRHFPEGAERRAAGWYVSIESLRDLFQRAAAAARGERPAPGRAHAMADAACDAVGL